MRRVAAIAAVVLLAACGGGGGGGGSDGKFIGVWNTSMNYQRGTCELQPEDVGLDRYVEPTYQINQDGTNVAVQNMASGISFNGGTMDDGKSLLATYPVPAIGCAGGFATGSFGMANLDGDEADAMYSIYISCPTFSPPDCELVWSGRAYRQ